jgi:hypothetical protein
MRRRYPRCEPPRGRLDWQHARPADTGRDYRQHLEVETPEHVVLDLEIAGVGSRALAAILDMIILVGSFLGVMTVLAILAGYGLTVGRLGSAILLLGGSRPGPATSFSSRVCARVRRLGSGRSASGW